MRPVVMQKPILQRQINKQVIDDTDHDIELGAKITDISAQEETDTTVVPESDIDPKQAQRDLDMFVNGHVMTKSTNMQSLNKQLQQLNNEILERQNQMTEVKTKMLQIQGALHVLQEINAKMKELRLSSPESVEPMSQMMSA